MKSLTIAYITSRHEPKFEWFADSYLQQAQDAAPVDLIVVDSNLASTGTMSEKYGCFNKRTITQPKPTIWQGNHRVTAEDWWAMSNARNTALCLCETDYIVWVDDRCVLMPTWLPAIRKAASEKYAVCGNYEKRIGMTVEHGCIQHGSIITGKDSRDNGHGLQNCYGQFWGGTYGMPTEWALNINGFEELVDGLGAEDYLCGMMLLNNGYQTKYDPALKIVEDRTPGECGPVMRKTDKGVSPKDKSHAALDKFGGQKRSSHPWNLREIRERVLRGEPFPNTDAFPRHDWYDGEPTANMKAPP